MQDLDDDASKPGTPLWVAIEDRCDRDALLGVIVLNRDDGEHEILLNRTALAPISRPAVSQHLRVLREAGLVRVTVGSPRLVRARRRSAVVERTQALTTREWQWAWVVWWSWRG